MEKIYLTSSEQALLDPTGSIRNMLHTLPHRGKETWADIPPFWEGITPERLFASYAEHLATLGDKHQPYIEHVHNHDSKLGRQGGFYAIEDLQTKVEEYFIAGEQEISIPQSLYRARDFFLKLCKEQIEKLGYPQFAPCAVKKTFGGIPSAQKKGSFAAESLGVNKISLQRFFPTIPWERRMRGKDRSIFMDATPNVRSQEGYLSAARKWFIQAFPMWFGSEQNPRKVVDPVITRAIDRKDWIVAWDYKSMDVNFRKKIAMELIYPIYELLFPDKAISIGCHFEQNFDQDVFFGNFLLRGTHSMLSGANITHDFENLYTIILVLAALLEDGLTEDALRTLLVCGDDMLASFKTEKQARRFFDRATQITEQVGMHFSLEKCDITQGKATYCRKAYYPSARRDASGVMYGAYPGNLVINSIIQPENPIFHEPTSLVADLTRLDNMIGSPDHTFVIQLLASCHRYEILRRQTPEEIVASLKATDYRDWWFDLYGERWSPDSSISFAPFLLSTPKKKRKETFDFR